MATGQQPRPGFQGSERTGIEVTFYPQNGDPIVIDQEPFSPKGRFRYDDTPAIIAASTQEQMGEGSAGWSLTLKAGKRHNFRELFADLIDDDWVDISFTRHGKKWHVIRGIITDMGRVKQAGSGQATSKTWTITGRSFSHIWEKTNIWFNPYTDENVAGAVSQRVFDSAENVLGNPAEAVTGFLRGMLSELGDVGRATWKMPGKIPNAQDTFINSVVLNTDGYPDVPKTIAISQNWLMPQGMLWDLAKEWSDPMFQELFTAQYRQKGDPPDYDLTPGEELNPDNSAMVVIFRERPFPTIEKGEDSFWFSLPMWVIPPQMITNSQVTRSGAERYNAFFVSSQVTQESIGSGAFDMARPIWNKDDILKHGLRRFDVVSKYTEPNGDFYALSFAQRTKIKDWYCLNPYFLSGTLQLAIGLPDIRLGTRVRVPGHQGPDADETYYVESVGHNWSLPSGLQTNLGVTRGWIGTDNSLLDALRKVGGAYTEAEFSGPTQYNEPAWWL